MSQVLCVVCWERQGMRVTEGGPKKKKANSLRGATFSRSDIPPPHNLDPPRFIRCAPASDVLGLRKMMENNTRSARAVLGIFQIASGTRSIG